MSSLFTIQNLINSFLIINSFYHFWYTSQLKKECTALLLENTQLKTEILQLKAQSEIFPILLGVGAFVLVISSVLFMSLYFGPSADSKAIIDSSHISNGLQLNSMTEQVNGLSSGLSTSLNLIMNKLSSIEFILTLNELKNEPVSTGSRILSNPELIQPDEAARLLTTMNDTFRNFSVFPPI